MYGLSFRTIALKRNNEASNNTAPKPNVEDSSVLHVSVFFSALLRKLKQWISNTKTVGNVYKRWEVQWPSQLFPTTSWLTLGESSCLRNELSWFLYFATVRNCSTGAVSSALQLLNDNSSKPLSVSNYVVTDSHYLLDREKSSYYQLSNRSCRLW
jgi:hypothetical protein